MRFAEAHHARSQAWGIPLVTAAILAAGCGSGTPQEELPIQGAAKPAAAVSDSETRQQQAVRSLGGGEDAPEGDTPKQILFGDLHVHSTFSFDAYMFSLPIMGGEGAHPPADACDFARYCSNLDFFALTDHAESLSIAHWERSKQTLRECNALAGDPSNPDLVAFVGYEWSQMGTTPETHFGHRCLVFSGSSDEELPPRPIASADKRLGYLSGAHSVNNTRFSDPLNWSAYKDYVAYAQAMADIPVCAEDVPTMELPAVCLEVAPTPAELHRKLDEWGGAVLEIPHGTAWGVYTPPTTNIRKHLEPAYFDPKRQRLVEIASGHGNSEEYREWRAWTLDESGKKICSEPRDDYLPCCWQAGEIMRSRCGDLPETECDRRVKLARRYAMDAGTAPHNVFPDASAEDWLDCGQCRDCFKPAYGYRPLESVQYAMALGEEDAADGGDRSQRFRYGFVASSDEHSSRPGVGYKAVDRDLMTDGSGARAPGQPDPEAPLSNMPKRPDPGGITLSGNDARVQAFLFPGGLAAVHSQSRSREDIWDAMQRREVYGTSGPRILLWFELRNAPDGANAPMGSAVRMDESPEFEVRAVGSFEPQPGCPEWAVQGLGAERTASLCHDECYHPSDTRRPIAAIEVVRILPQTRAGEPVEALIQDPWRRFDCEADPTGCKARFRDEEFPSLGRDALYYARALEETRPAILGDPLRTRFDETGQAVEIEMCDLDDDCLSPTQERAWSSPIFVDFL